jgi:putative transposase
VPIEDHSPWRRSLRRTMKEYVEHYHTERNHQGKGNVLLFQRVTEARRDNPLQCFCPASGR